ncbi:MAG: biotin/lipoyl-containing protein, partial [Caldimonas sp.]
PSPEAIDAMGDKAGAKALMLAAGVPCIAGYSGTESTEAALAARADAIGYPVMIKASAGGGGRGMRRVGRADGFVAALRSARSEAQGAFGDDRVILERALVGARHIEVQVFADRQGNRVHLGERDCSVQRRHQKLIEEAPSPAVDAGLRERLGATALAALDAVAYEGAGTIEFLLDGEGAYFFMEMNTRLQVEHPVTEAITGLDLVEWQLRIAAGEPLPLAQHEIRFEGHAIEARLCAEDPLDSFMPQSGTLTLWRPPEGLRVEHALRSGMCIAPHYDSMIAKLVAHGPDRDDARRRLVAGLCDVVALGVPTNAAFLARCASDPVFARGGATTAFIDERAALLLAGAAAETDRSAAASRQPDAASTANEAGRRERRAALAALLCFQVPRHGAVCAVRTRPVVPALAHRLALPMRLKVGGADVAASVRRVGPDVVSVGLGPREVVFELVEQGPDRLDFICDGVLESATFAADAQGLWFHHRGESLRVDDRTRSPPERASDAASDGIVRASISGRIVAVHVRAGDVVEAGARLVTLEAMKMEHAHPAPCAGTVVSVPVVPGEQVASGRVLVEIEAAAELPADATTEGRKEKT